MLKQYYEKKIQELEEEKQRLQSQIVPYTRFSLLDRLFRRKRVKEYEERFDPGRNSSINLDVSQINIKIENLNKERQTGCFSRETIDELIELFKNGKIDYEFEKADENIGAYMYENYVERSSSPLDKDRMMETFKGLDDFLLVHKTNFFPSNDTIYTPKSTQAKRKTSFTFRGKEYQIDTPVSNNTTHFALNGPVSSHMYGDWDSTRYAIVTNFNDVNRENLLAINLEDTYFEGNVHLKKKYYILVPKSEVEKFKQSKLDLNPNAIIVPYDGIKLDKAVSGLIACLGKMPEVISNNNWAERNDEIIKSAIKALEPYQKGDKYKGGKHAYSENMQQKLLEQRANTIISIYEFLQNNGLNPTLEELKELLKTQPYGGFLNKEVNDLHGKYYIDVFKNKGYIIPEDILQDKRLKIPPYKRDGYRDNSDKYYSKLDIFEEYIFKALLDGKEQQRNCKEEGIEVSEPIE